MLTHDELGEYAATATSISASYYWSDTCHFKNTNGYTDTDSSGCSGHNDYEGSKIKEFLEEDYINWLGIGNFKDVDNYKIRLITKEELENLMIENRIWIYIDGSYWTMTSQVKRSTHAYRLNSTVLSANTIYNAYGVRPVINLYKSSIE